MPRNRYPQPSIPPIANITSLASLLSVNVTDLLYIADNINLFYKPGKILQKKNGEHRYTHDAKRTLKLIHQHIKNRILKKLSILTLC